MLVFHRSCEEPWNPIEGKKYIKMGNFLIINFINLYRAREYTTSYIIIFYTHEFFGYVFHCGITLGHILLISNSTFRNNVATCELKLKNNPIIILVL